MRCWLGILTATRSGLRIKGKSLIPFSSPLGGLLILRFLMYSNGNDATTQE